MNKNPLLYAAGLMAVAGLMFLFTLESKVTGLLLIVSALCFTVVMMHQKNQSAASEQKPKPEADDATDQQEKKDT